MHICTKTKNNARKAKNNVKIRYDLSSKTDHTVFLAGKNKTFSDLCNKTTFFLTNQCWGSNIVA